MPGIPKLNNLKTIANTYDINKIINVLNGILLRNTNASQSVTASTATTSISLASTNSVLLALNASTTITLTDYSVGVYMFVITQSGNKTLTITNCKTPAGSAGIINVTATAGAIDVLRIVCDGTNLLGDIIKAYA